MYTIDIDVGGTFTDGLFSDGARVTPVKVDTTPHDLTVCFMDLLQTGADQLGFNDLNALLAQTSLIRWSTTITTNVLAERRGPRLGLFVSKGHEQDLYSDGASPALEIIGQENVIGLAQPIDQAAVLALVKQLLERGVRRVCISLGGAFADASEERAIQDTIAHQYPDHYLGSVPVLLGSDIAKHPDDMTRTHIALINAYVHGPLASTLFKAEDTLRDQFGWKRRLLIGHQNGGVARVAKTRAVDTIESGPAMGLYASAYFARRYKRDHVIALDVGGTTAKISLIHAALPALNRASDVFGIPLKTPVADISSLALGGGSIARVENGNARLGPESMGAYPGPACYDLGGTEATFTDAALTLGYLNPDNFLGGARSLNVESARSAIQTHVAAPLGMSVDDAAAKIFQTAIQMVADAIKTRLDAADYTLFAYGGNGALFAAGVAARLGLKDAYAFDLGAVFSVLGSSLADILHVYEHALHVQSDEAGAEKLNAAVGAMREDALRDMAGEELDLKQVKLALDLDVRGADGVTTKSLPLSRTNGNLDAAALQEFAGDGVIELARVRATYKVGGYDAARAKLGAADSSAAKVGARSVNWDGNVSETNIYAWETLVAGNVVTGPAVIESASTTYLVPPKWKLKKDKWSNAHLTRA